MNNSDSNFSNQVIYETIVVTQVELACLMVQNLLPETSVSAFNNLGFLSRALEVLPLIGVQAPLFVPLLIANGSNILSDLVAFTMVIRQVWGLWKLKKSLGLKGNQDLITALIEQVVLTFSASFVLFITITATILFETSLVGSILFAFQNVLSTLLICEFTLALRRRSCPKNCESDANQSTLLISLPQDNPTGSMSPVAEMGERNALVDIEHGGPNDSQDNGI
ncbi:hypothetical protein Clacol_009735 [Clathrus columnatus]|uniref:Uncharacterized protein n=1 Tax=Clathrus columnatus TaxID=1419009 RepID=A0AAV5ANT2_9AGAM|nr:hypothetical protein Clacol_009735 [Clathrus columnatus]